MLLLWPSTDWDDVSCSVFFSLHTFLLASLFSGKLCEATWPLFSLVASAFDVALFGRVVSLVFGVTCLMKLQNYNKKFRFQAKLESSHILRH